MKAFLAALLMAVAAGPAAGHGDVAATTIAWRHGQLQQLHESLHGTSEAARGAALASRFRALYPDAIAPAALQASDVATLHLRFDDAVLANFYRPDGYALGAMRAALAELERRHAAQPPELLRMRNALLAAKRFDEAARFGTSHPEAALAPLPRFVDGGNASAGQPSAWRQAADGRFERIALDLRPAQVLVLAGCHFAGDAASGIAADPVLGPVFRDHATWLGMPPGAEDPADIAEWNTRHPQAPMLAIYDRDDWPMFADWIMPTFYLVRDGQVQGVVRGWRTEDSRDLLVAMLTEAGLLGPVAAPSATVKATGR